MARPPTKRSEHETVVTLRLPRELHERLKQEAGERGFAAEVRRRLEASLEAGASPDDATRDFLRASRAMAGALSQEGAADDRSQMFREAIELLANALFPKPPTWHTWHQHFASQSKAAALAAYGIGTLGAAADNSNPRSEAYLNLLNQAAEARFTLRAAQDPSSEGGEEESP